MYLQLVTEYNVTSISGTQPRKNMVMGKVDTSDLMMIITWAMDISSQPPKLKWASWTHTTPYILLKMKGNLMLKDLDNKLILCCKFMNDKNILLVIWSVSLNSHKTLCVQIAANENHRKPIRAITRLAIHYHNNYTAPPPPPPASEY